MSQSEPETDLISWLEQQWDKAVKDSETPDGELLEKYTFYDGLTTAYEFTIARVKQYGVQPTTDSRTAASKLTVTLDGRLLRGRVRDHRTGNGSCILANVNALCSQSHVNAETV